MGRGSLVGRRAMSGRVKRTDGGEGSEMCVQGSERRSGGGRKRWRGEWGGNGCIAENGSVMSSEKVEEYGENEQKEG